MANKRSENARDRSMKLLRELLSQPEYRGRRVGVSEIVSKLGRSRQWFYESIGNAKLAQEWLRINQQAPTDAKVHYQAMLDKALSEIEPKDVKLEAQTKQGKKQFFVTREQAQEKTKQVGHVIAGTIRPPTVTVEQKSVEVVEVTEKEQWINRLRENYVTAELGEIPNITKLMRDLGLTDKNGTALRGLTEEEVRRQMALEDWKQQRAQFLHKTLDVVPEELKMVTMMRNVEVQKILFNEIKMLSRANTQYWSRGRVRTLDGSMDLEYSPDSGTIAGLAEVMRRMLDGGTNVNFLQINQFGDKGGADNGVSQLARNYLGRLASLNPEQIRDEITRFEALNRLLSGDTDERLTMDDIEAQETEVIEVTAKPDKT